MSHNSFGQLFRVTTFGESHGAALGCVVDGAPPGLPLTEADIQREKSSLDQERGRVNADREKLLAEIEHLQGEKKEIENEREIDAFAAELVDRFGKLPEEVEHLLQVVAIKALSRRANIEKVDAGPKGIVLAFRDNVFANPEGLIAYIREQAANVRIRPDQKVVFFGDWPRPQDRLKGTAAVIRKLA